MSVELRLGNGWSEICSIDDTLIDQIKKSVTFKNKSAEFAYQRFRLGCQARERSFGDEPSDAYIEWKKQRLAELAGQINVCCVKKDNGLWVPTGLVPKLAKEFGDKVWIVDKRNTEGSRRILSGTQPSKWRKPQLEAMTALESEHFQKWRMGLLKIATGVGKTVIGQEVIRKFGVPTVFLVPSRSTLNQTYSRFESAFGKNNVACYGDGKKKLSYVTVATYQSVFKADNTVFSDAKLVIYDEIHHIGAETFYSVALDRFPNAIWRIGLTATDERADGGTILVESGAGPIIYEYTAAQGIADGYLAKPTFLIYDVKDTEGGFAAYKSKKNERVFMGNVKATPYNGPDENTAYKHWVLGNDKLTRFVAQLVNSIVAQGKQTVILVDEKDHGRKLQSLIPSAGFSFSGAKDNDELQELFNRRKLPVLIGTSTIGEGTDLVPVDVLICLQGGCTPGRIRQNDGRALRNDPDDNGVPRKPKVLVIDFDFVNCPILHRHSIRRAEVHREIGEIHRATL